MLRNAKEEGDDPLRTELTIRAMALLTELSTTTWKRESVAIMARHGIEGMPRTVALPPLLSSMLAVAGTLIPHATVGTELSASEAAAVLAQAIQEANRIVTECVDEAIAHLSAQEAEQ